MSCPNCGAEEEESEMARTLRVHRAVREFYRERPEPTHTLKIQPEFFDAVSDGRKTFEVRRGNDRIYKVGDVVLLREFIQETGYTGHELTVEITYVMHGPPLLTDDIWVFGVKRA